MEARTEYIEHYDRYLHSLLQEPEAAAYICRAYDFLEFGMKHGQTLRLHADARKLPWLLVAVGAFLEAADHRLHYSLNDDCTALRYFEPPPRKPSFFSSHSGKE